MHVHIHMQSYVRIWQSMFERLGINAREIPWKWLTLTCTSRDKSNGTRVRSFLVHVLSPRMASWEEVHVNHHHVNDDHTDVKTCALGAHQFQIRAMQMLERRAYCLESVTLPSEQQQLHSYSLIMCIHFSTSASLHIAHRDSAREIGTIWRERDKMRYANSAASR